MSTTTYILKGARSSLTLSEGTVTTGTIEFSVSHNDTDSDFALTPAEVPSASGVTGNYSVNVQVVTGQTDADITVRLVRVNSGGTVQTESDYADAQTATAGLKTFSFTDLNLGTWATGDRLRVDYYATRFTGKGGTTFTVRTGADSGVTAPWEIVPFTEPSITTSSASGVSADSATLNANLTDLGDATSVDVFFEYKEQSSGTWSSTTKTERTATGTFNQSLSGLNSNADYEFRAVVEYEDEGTQRIEGSVLTFKTDAIQYTLTVSKEGNGSTTPTTGEHQYNENTNVGLLAEPDSGHRFVKWVIGGVDDFDADTSVLMDGNKTVTAYFEVIPQYTLSISKEGEGSIELDNSPIILPYEEELYDDDYNLEAIPNQYNSFDKWVVNSSDVTENPTIITLDINTTVVAHFIGENKIVIERGEGETPSEWSNIDEIGLEENEYKDVSVLTKEQVYSYRIKKIQDGVLLTAPIQLNIELGLKDAPASIVLKWGE